MKNIKALMKARRCAKWRLGKRCGCPALIDSPFCWHHDKSEGGDARRIIAQAWRELIKQKKF